MFEGMSACARLRNRRPCGALPARRGTVTERLAAGDEAPVYLLHGLMGTAPGHFAEQIRSWRDKRQMVPVDLPGHGKCPLDAASPYYPQAVSFLYALVGRFGPGHLVAASYLGGTVAVRATLARPGLARSLVLTGFSPGVPGPVMAGWVGGFDTLAERNPEVVEQYEKLHGSRWRQTLAAVSGDIRDRYATDVAVTGEMIAALGIPVLIANGSIKSDERVVAESATELGPLVRGEVIEGAGHIAGHDRPEHFNQAVSAFWEEVNADVPATGA